MKNVAVFDRVLYVLLGIASVVFVLLAINAVRLQTQKTLVLQLRERAASAYYKYKPPSETIDDCANRLQTNWQIDPRMKDGFGPGANALVICSEWAHPLNLTPTIFDRIPEEELLSCNESYPSDDKAFNECLWKK